ncbi:MAG: hypothetical protein HYT27_03170 [Parcubacteria group bacterium]|nr:hypothetical protein [Parcubacteria group bacterium]
MDIISNSNRSTENQRILHIIPEQHIDEVNRGIDETGISYVGIGGALPPQFTRIIPAGILADRALTLFGNFLDKIEERLTGLCPKDVIIYQESVVTDIETLEVETHQWFVELLVDAMRRECPHSPFVRIAGPLLKEGATLIGVESQELLEECERQINALDNKAFQKILRAEKSLSEVYPPFIKNRDIFIAEQIGKTLHLGKIGVLMIGAAHYVERHLPLDITVVLHRDLFDEYEHAFENIIK